MIQGNAACTFRHNVQGSALTYKGILLNKIQESNIPFVERISDKK
jgi:hypothetical protein